MSDPPTLRIITLDELAQHQTVDSLWLSIAGLVYDLTRFIDSHPGGPSALLDAEIAGRQVDDAFFSLHRSEVLQRYSHLVIGRLEGPPSRVILPWQVSVSPVPYAEPYGLSAPLTSHYYNDSHRTFQQDARAFVRTVLDPEGKLHDAMGKPPSAEMLLRVGQAHLPAMRLGPSELLHGKKLFGDVRGEDFDCFHELILVQELALQEGRGYQAGLGGGNHIGLPPVLAFGTRRLREEVVPEVLAGRKVICLAITEATGGSDVAGLRTTARRSADGRHFVVNGVKKWITNSPWADYFTTAVMTEKGISVLVIPRVEGVESTDISTVYSSASGTGLLSFKDVLVPVDNLLGVEGQGLKVILANFNHERWKLCADATRKQRLVTTECFQWAHQRKVFGKRLIDQPVIRQKFGHMFALVEGDQAWLESLTERMQSAHRLTDLTARREAADSLAGPLALLKLRLTRHAHEIADHAVQIFGGRALTATGMGRKVFSFYRSYKVDSVGGGAEEIMADLAVRQAMKRMPQAKL